MSVASCRRLPVAKCSSCCHQRPANATDTMRHMVHRNVPERSVQSGQILGVNFWIFGQELIDVVLTAWRNAC